MVGQGKSESGGTVKSTSSREKTRGGLQNRAKWNAYRFTQRANHTKRDRAETRAGIEPGIQDDARCGGIRPSGRGRRFYIRGQRIRGGSLALSRHANGPLLFRGWFELLGVLAYALRVKLFLVVQFHNLPCRQHVAHHTESVTLRADNCFAHGDILVLQAS